MIDREGWSAASLVAGSVTADKITGHDVDLSTLYAHDLSPSRPVTRRGRYHLLRDLGAALSELFVHLTPPRHRA